jgi:hypothetical protein
MMCSRSEAFGTQQRHDEIDAESNGNGEAKQRFKHWNPLQPVERAGVERKHEKRAAAERDEDEVGHIRFSC